MYSLNVKLVPERWRTGSKTGVSGVSSESSESGETGATATSPVDGVGDLEGLVGVVVIHHVNVRATIARSANFFIFIMKDKTFAIIVICDGFCKRKLYIL